MATVAAARKSMLQNQIMSYAHTHTHTIYTHTHTHMYELSMKNDLNLIIPDRISYVIFSLLPNLLSIATTGPVIGEY